MAQDDDPYGINGANLTPAERAYMNSVMKPQTPAGGPPAASGGAVPSLPPATGTPAVTAPATVPDPYGQGTGRGPAFQAGMIRGVGTVLNSIPNVYSHLTGTPYTPWADPNAALSPAEAAAAQLHPNVAAVGKGTGEALPALAFAPVAGEGIAGNALLGAGQALATSAENPNQSLITRAGVGALEGGILSKIGGVIGHWFGSDVKAAGDERALTQGFGKILGQDVKDLSPGAGGSYDTMMNNLGQNVGDAAAKGQINYDTIEGPLGDIQSDAAGTPQQATVNRLLNNVLSKIDWSSGQISGPDFADLIGHNGVLDRAIRGRPAEIADYADRIKDALQGGFEASSPSGVAQALSDARGKYKLGLALGDDLLKSGGSYIQPSTIMQTFAKNKWMGPSMVRSGVGPGGGGGAFDQAADLARAANLSGGGTVAQAPGFFQKYVLPAVGLGGIVEGSHLLPALMHPSAIGNALSAGAASLPVLAGAAATGAGAGGLYVAGRALQRTPWFVNRLMEPGGVRPLTNLLIRNPVTVGGVTLGTQASPQ